ncbi:MAG: hypothetical protein FJ319_04345 [SAR202 cluster bacterium]|nr:hypothetical protein [SAR202 cluster bacterium]
MRRPRLIYYSDAHHFHGKRLDPPLNMHKMRWPVDELLGTGVEMLTFGLGFGDVFFHQTKIGRIIGQDQETWKSFINWRIMRMVKDAHSMGTDQLQEVIRRSRQMRLPVFPSLKLQDPAAPGDERCGRLKMTKGKEVTLGVSDSRFPDYKTEWCYDYANEQVRNEKLALLREVLEDYQAEGIDLDFMFFPLYFKEADTEKNIPIMNQFVAEVKRMASEVEGRQGREVPVMARVWSRKEENLRFGLDPESWLRSKSVDMVVAQPAGQMMDTGIREAAWLAESANAAGAAAYFRTPRKVSDVRTNIANIEMYRAASQTLFAQGFTGMFLGYLPWPFAEGEYSLLREMAFPEATGRRDKRYFIASTEKMPSYSAPDGRQLPTDLKEGQTTTLNVVVSDDVENARREGEMRDPTLTVAFRFYCVEDEVEFKLNGAVLPAASTELLEPHRGSYWLRWKLDAALVKRGDNKLEITDRKMAKLAAFTRTVTGVELHLRYKDFQRPEGLEVNRLAPPS